MQQSISRKNKPLFNRSIQTNNISIIPNIQQAKQLLPKFLQFSKPVSHIVKNNFKDIKSQSGKMQQLYTKNYINNDMKSSLKFDSDKNQRNQKCFYQSLLRDHINPKDKKPKNATLKKLFLQNSDNIIFISRMITMLLDRTGKYNFNKISNQNLFKNSQQAIKNYQNYKKSIQNITSELQLNLQFPYLCPEQHQIVEQSNSFKKINIQNCSMLQFDDNFQSSNILMASQLSNPSQIPIYIISTRFDYQTSTYGQWFYFKVKNSQPNYSNQSHQQINKITNNFKLIICNMTKTQSMLGKQMKISVCRKGIWGKQGKNICYYQTSIKRHSQINKQSKLNKYPEDNKQSKTIQNLLIQNKHQYYYALQFQIQIQLEEQIYISYNQPYSVSRISLLIDTISRKFYEQQEACRLSKINSTCEQNPSYSLAQRSNHQKQSSTQSLNNYKHSLSQYSSNLKHLSASCSSKQRQSLRQYQKKQKQIKLFFKREVICETPLKNQIQCLTFVKKKFKYQQQFLNDEIGLEKSFTQQVEKDKKIIFLFARSHPIQTSGSFVLQGFIKELILYLQYQNDNHKKQQLKQIFNKNAKEKLLQNLFQKFIIKIIPVVNPDGVVLGNSRCNLYGFDLNRRWKNTKKAQAPEIYAIKNYLLKFQSRIQMVIDLHGHSNKKNVFAYGMHDFLNPYSTRQFPFILSKLSQKNFLFKQCRFTRLSDLKYESPNNSQNKSKYHSKQGTARIWLFRKLNIPNIFTIENSYCGSIHSQYHYDCQTYGNIGGQILRAITIYFIQYQLKTKLKHKKQTSSKLKHHKQKVFQTDQISNPLQQNETSLDQFKIYKQSMMLDLKSKQQNISIGMDSINSSQSEDQLRVDQQHQSKKSNTLSSAKSHKLFKKTQSKQKEVPRYMYKFDNNQTSQKNISKSSNLMNNEANLLNKKDSQMKVIKSQKKIKTSSIRCLPTQVGGQTKPIKKQASSAKILANFNRNNTLSVVEIGWGNLPASKNYQSDRTNKHTQIPNHPLYLNHHMNLNPPASLNYPTSLNYLVGLSQVNKNIANKLHRHNNFGQANEGNSGGQILQCLQTKKNVSEFIKKLEESRRHQSEYLTSKKIQKYRQIISKIKGGNQYLPN